MATSPAQAEPEAPLLPAGGKLAFRVMRGGKQIGDHVNTFEQRGGALTIRAEAEIAVHMIGIPVFRYVFHGVERWQGGRFMSLETRTDDDGTQYWVRAERDAAGLVVTGSATPRYVAPAEAIPMTHWNRQELLVPKINPQKGELLRPTVRDGGVGEVPTASGRPIQAKHYTFSGDATLDVWFDLEGQWAALAFLGSDQSRITLERR